MLARDIRSVLLGLAGLWLAAPAAGQEPCTTGRIDEIRIETQSIFDVASATSEDEGVFSRVSNALHVRTRESFIRGELLFEEGDCLDPFLISESERLLRSRPFIKEATVTAQPDAAGRLVVLVRTRDDWSLGISLGISFDEGLSFDGIGVTERNFLGRGAILGITRKSDRELEEIGGALGATRLLGSPLEFSAGVGETRVGTFVDQTLMLPFNSEIDRFAIRQQVAVREDYFAYSLGESETPSHALLPFEREAVSVTGMYRAGDPGRLLLLGGGISRERLDFPTDLDALDIVNNSDFEAIVGGGGAVEREAVRGQTDPLSVTRVNALIGFRRISYLVRNNLDGVHAVQDVKVGSEVVVTLGRSVKLFDDLDDANDAYARLEIFRAGAVGQLVISTDGRLEGRRIFGDGPGSGEWRDVIGEANGRVYWQPDGLPGHTIFGRLAAAGAWSMDRPFQLTGGGRDGVRGYSRDAFPGGRRVVLTMEDRSVLLSGDGLDVGLSLFADAGRVWAGDVPFGEDSGWRASVGAGFRISAPGGRLGPTRFDLTFPVTGDRETQGVLFRFYTEVGGLFKAPGYRSQAERSRWSGVDADLTVRPSG